MKITKKIITKIEGEATLKLYKKDSLIEFAEIEFWQYRGMEEYLKNRNYMDACVINPRICGICGHSHLIATSKAIENALNIKITKKAKILREITLGLEIIQNHIKWFYITLYPSVKEINYFKALEFSREIAKIIALIAGQFPHNSYAVPGGVTCDLTNLEIIKVKNFLSKMFDKYQEIIDINGKSEDLEILFEDIPKETGKGINKFLVLGDNLYFKSNGNAEFIKEEDSISLNKNVLYKGSFYEVGPLARNLENYLIKKVYEKYQDSIYTRIFARLYEVNLIFQYLLKRIDEIDINEKNYIKPTKKSGKGVGIVEAPRGSLIHQIEIEDEKIKSYNIIVPTQFNLSNGTKESPSPAQASLIGEYEKQSDLIFKCFDICAVCVSH